MKIKVIIASLSMLALVGCSAIGAPVLGEKEQTFVTQKANELIPTTTENGRIVRGVGLVYVVIEAIKERVVERRADNPALLLTNAKLLLSVMDVAENLPKGDWANRQLFDIRSKILRTLIDSGMSALPVSAIKTFVGGIEIGDVLGAVSNIARSKYIIQDVAAIVAQVEAEENPRSVEDAVASIKAEAEKAVAAIEQVVNI